MKNTDVEGNSIRWDKTLGRPQPAQAWVAVKEDIVNDIRDNPAARQEILDRAQALVSLDTSGERFGGSPQYAAHEVLRVDAMEIVRTKGDYWKDWEK